MDLMRLAGFDTVRVTSIWDPSQTQPTSNEVTVLSNVAQAAELDGMQAFVSVYNFGSKTTPFSEEDQRNFASYAAGIASQVPEVRNFIVGNEPNLNRFWLPQFNPDGTTRPRPRT